MKLLLETHLEAVDMGSQEIAKFIENHPKWLDYVNTVNINGIPPNDSGEYPTDEWLDNEGFHPDDLISEACKHLKWDSVPSTGGLLMNFVHKPIDY